MEPAEWNQIFELFHAVREKSGRDRVILLDTACGENTLLRKAVEELLKEDESADGFLSKPFLSAIAGGPHINEIVSGQIFGHYQVERLVGQGGMGQVWSAHDADLDRPVALKFLSTEALAILDTEQITREAKAGSALNHPNIVTIHEIVQAESTLAIVMELVEGESLRQLLGAPLSTAKVLAISSQLAEALAAAHGAGIVHGDIKPENILLRQDGYVKVLDFGLARRFTTETTASAGEIGLGTLRYMSPEQARGEPLMPPSDIFSLGLVLYELATGRHAFPAASPLDTAQAILRQKQVPVCDVNPAIPARLNLLIGTMLAKQPSARPSAEEVTRTLDELQRPRKAHSDAVAAIWKWAIAALLLIAVCLGAWVWKPARSAGSIASLRQITTLVPENRATAVAISPDGKLAAYANVDGIFARAIQNNETKALLAPGDFVVDWLAWFTDGERLVASGFSNGTNLPEVWLISVRGAPARELRTHARQAAPSPDGKHIAFISQDRSEVWVMGTSGEEPRRIVSGRAGDSFPLVFWSPDGRHLGLQQRHYSAGRQLWGLDLERFYQRRYQSVDLSTARITASMDLWLNSASWLPDGRLIYLGFDTSSSDFTQRLWEAKTDPRTGAFLGPPRKIAIPVMEPGSGINEMSATNDGKLVMVIKDSEQNATFVGDFDRSIPVISNIRRLTLDERTSYPHAWTRDSRAVIFESDRAGSWDIFRQRIDQRTAEPIVATHLMEVLPQLGPDGHWLLYEARPPGPKQLNDKLMRVPVDGGTPEEVSIGEPLDEFRCALDSGKRCVLRSSVRSQYRAFYELDPIYGKGRELTRTKWFPENTCDWDVSPDGRYVALPNHDSRDARIRVLALEPSPNEPREREVRLPGLSDLKGLVWAAGGEGWFVSVNMTFGNRLLFVYPNGRFRSLGDIQGWGVPSPDGRRVAFLDRIVATNAWLIERH